MRVVLFVLLGSSIFSCSSTGAVHEIDRNNFFNTIPSRDELVFIGVAAASIFKQNAIQAALEDAARKVSFFHSISGEIASYQSGGSLVGNTFKNPRELWPAEDYKKYVADLQYNAEHDVLERNQAVFVRTRYKVQQAPSLVYTYAPQDQKPAWIHNPPAEVSGYSCGVGVSNKYLQYKDMVLSSYEDAVFSIIKSQAVQVRDLSTQTASLNSSSLLYSKGTLYGFYVVDMWTDPETQLVWTLAIAKKSSK
ncbi:hypothetical protein ACYULU_00435 [Breznakiellaceae bacterium SP9]